MNPLRQMFRWMLFVIRNRGRTPEYPFMNNGAEQPLELRIGPWGSTQYYDRDKDVLCEVRTVSTAVEIAESIEVDVYGCSYSQIRQQEEEKARAVESRKKSPQAIGFYT